jgi:uncharacterized membrane protein YbaN (DUF454 family)
MGSLESVSAVAPVARAASVRVRRYLHLVGGCVALSTGLVGIVVPGLPTTVFVIVASYCFTRSCPRLEAWMRASPLLAPYLRYVDAGAPMPFRARVTATALLWMGIGASMAVLEARGEVAPWLLVTLVTGGIVGSIAIALVGRRRRAREA